MADIVVRGMDMPESCFECVTTNSFFRNLHCDKLEGMSGFVGSLPHKNDRHPNCPLVPLPEKHGRLIDADALIRDKSGEATLWCGYEYQDHSVVFEEDIKNAPTIVPAEGVENE